MNSGKDDKGGIWFWDLNGPNGLYRDHEKDVGENGRVSKRSVVDLNVHVILDLRSSSRMF